MVEAGDPFCSIEEKFKGRVAQIFFVIGPEGSGKSVQTKNLEEDFGLPRIYTGDFLRVVQADVTDQSPLAERIREMFLNNSYLDPVDALAICKINFSEPRLKKGFIMDGTPRTLEEASGIPYILNVSGFDLRSVNITFLQLECPIPVCIERLKNRVDQDGRKRSDDTIIGVVRRLSNYHKQADRIAQYARDNWSLVKIDARGQVDEVFERIKQNLGVEKMLIQGKYMLVN